MAFTRQSWKALDRAMAHAPLRLRERYRMWRWLDYWPDLMHPRTFNEHIKSRLLHDRDERLITVCDKWAVREWVAERIGSEYLTHATAEVQAGLPPRFVAKPTHMSGQVFTAPEDGHVAELRRKSEEWLNAPYGVDKGEWYYGEMPRRVIIEERLEDQTWGEPLDYKFFCWNGRFEILQIDFTRFTNHRQWFMGRNGQRLRMAFRNFPQYEEPITLPPNFADMVIVAETLSQDFDFMRVDLYNINESRILFGEMTPAPWAGVAVFNPPHFDEFFGQFFNWRHYADSRPEVEDHVFGGHKIA